MAFKNLFRSSETPNDGLSQAAREAIVDVLHYCMYADQHISTREDEFIENAARSLSWDARVSYEYYEGKSTGAVRSAVANAESRQAFFESLRARMPGQKERDLALSLAEQLTRTDGTKSIGEAVALRDLRQALGS